METVKIKFADVPEEFNTEDNFIVKALRQNFNVVFSDTPDYLFYSVFGMSFLRYGCVRIFFSGEPVVPNFNDCDYAIDYNNIYFGVRHFRAAGIIGNVGVEVSSNIQDRSFVRDEMADRNFCNFVYSNESKGFGARLRKEFCQKLSAYKKVDCPGKVLNNMESAAGRRYELTGSLAQKVFDESWAASKLEFLSGYKFTIAFENTAMSGYATEKLFHPLIVGSVPIYWGDPDVARDFNPKAFINCGDFNGNLDAVVDRVIELDNDSEQYLDMLRQSPMQHTYDFDQGGRLAEYLSGIIGRGKNPYEKNALGFSTVSAVDFIDHCYNGDIGFRIVAKAAKGWLHYKLHRK
jgi:hypothetical protein